MCHLFYKIEKKKYLNKIKLLHKQIELILLNSKSQKKTLYRYLIIFEIKKDIISITMYKKMQKATYSQNNL